MTTLLRSFSHLSPFVTQKVVIKIKNMTNYIVEFWMDHESKITQKFVNTDFSHQTGSQFMMSHFFCIGACMGIYYMNIRFLSAPFINFTYMVHR
ncbi:unnamed protein product [Callosobruchus maculatus]|uniref:Uncharacterized protein n=1 Tax=Callosobruchus maculatus TaxID=64391 RepID=A0A653CVA5_CALMS|nr:unnamed protein product [Callosobruchus maculatus]